MPPKSSKKVDTTAGTRKSIQPSKVAAKIQVTTTPEPTPTPPPSISKFKPVVKRTKVDTPTIDLKVVGLGCMPITGTYENSEHAKAIKTGFTHTVKLTATDRFEIIGTCILDNGPHKGRQAIILQQAQAFKFEALSPDVRRQIYDIYFANKNVLDAPIALEGKRKWSGDLYAKSYAEGSKHRVGLLATSKKIHQEALPVLYSKPLKLENPGALLNFLANLPTALKDRLRDITVVNFKAANTKTAMAWASEARNITRFHIEGGLVTAKEPAKSADVFFCETRKFLEKLTSVLQQRNSDATMLDAYKVFSFGPNAFAHKDGKYVATEQQIFQNTIEAKLK